jgi:hypothetical protein
LRTQDSISPAAGDLHILPVEDAWQPRHIEDNRPNVLKIEEVK